MKYKVEILYESFEKPDWVSILKQLKDEGKEGFPWSTDGIQTEIGAGHYLHRTT